MVAHTTKKLMENKTRRTFKKIAGFCAILAFLVGSYGLIFPH